MSQVFIIGFGKFGKLALTQVARLWGKARVWIIDTRAEALIKPNSEPFSGIRVLADGPQFLTRFQKWIRDEDWIIPALPVHLAWNWLELNLKFPEGHRTVLPSKSFDWGLPFHQVSHKGLFLSYADFVCPENCPAPLGRCFKTKEKRAVPLWKFIADQPCPTDTVEVIESLQIAPGVGGYAFKELRRIRDLAGKADPPFL